MVTVSVATATVAHAEWIKAPNTGPTSEVTGGVGGKPESVASRPGLGLIYWLRNQTRNSRSPSSGLANVSLTNPPRHATRLVFGFLAGVHLSPLGFVRGSRHQDRSAGRR